jgi:hypothetical protein
MQMRAVIIVRHGRSYLGPFEVGPQAIMVLKSLPGVSEIRLDSEDSNGATISYRWKDPGAHSASIGVAFASNGMHLI